VETIGVFFAIWSLSAILMDAFLRDGLQGSRADGLRDEIANIPPVDFTGKFHESQNSFLRFFDRVYGERRRFGTFFFRSSISSTFALGTSLFLFYQLHPSFPGSVSEVFRRPQPYVWICCMVLGNLLADYVSLHETRWLLAKAKNRAVPFLFGLMAVDFVLSYAIFEAIAVPVSETLLNPGVTWPFHSFWVTDIDNTTGGKDVAPFVLSTFFTSVIFYFFVAWTFVVKAAERQWQFVQRMLQRIAGSRRPFITAILLLSVPAAVLTMVVKFFTWMGTALLGG